MAHLFIIAGHGSGDSGAVGNGYTEAERVRALASRISAIGGDNVTVGDTSKDWYRSKLINTLDITKDWCICELHMDGAAPTARGGHVIIKNGYAPDTYDQKLAAFISGIMPGRSNAIVGRDNLANVNRAAARGLNYRLLECGFITNAADVATFNNNMDEIAKGILSSFGINTSSAGKWIKDDKGWWYRNTDGTYQKNSWLKLDSWYWFDGEGYAVTGWRKINEKWYYFDSNCRMLTGWQKVDEKWYYLNSNGDMLDGWQLIGGRWYYLTPESGKSDDYPHGSMQTGFVDDGEHTYYCRPENENGAPEGSMVTGWLQLEEDWYYFNADKNCQPVGSMLRNHWQGKYYLKDDGRMAKSETLVIGGKEYTFAEDGKVE